MGDNSKQKQHSGTVLVGAIKQEGASAKEHTELTQVQPKLEMSDNGRAKSTTTCATELDSQSHPNSSDSKGGRPVTSDTNILQSISKMVHTMIQKTNELNDMLSAKGHEKSKSILHEIFSLQSEIKDNLHNLDNNYQILKVSENGADQSLECKIKSEKPSSMSQMSQPESNQAISSSSKGIPQTDNKDKHSIGFPFMEESDIYVCFEYAHKCMSWPKVDKKAEEEFTADLSTIVHNYVKSCRDLASEAQGDIQKLLGKCSIDITMDFLSRFQLQEVPPMIRALQNEYNSGLSKESKEQSKDKCKMFLVFPFITRADIEECFKQIYGAIKIRMDNNESNVKSLHGTLCDIMTPCMTSFSDIHNATRTSIQDLAERLSIILTIHDSSPFQLKPVGNVTNSQDKLKSTYVVYKFTCAAEGCKKIYIGKTTQQLSKRISQQLNDTNCAIYQHQRDCNKAIDKEKCFEVIDSATTDEQLKIKKALHIMWQKPAINRQKTHQCLTLGYS